MQVVKISPRGYCQGVTSALRLVKDTIRNHPNEPIYLLGMIVNNQLVNQALLQNNVKLLDNSKTKEEWIETIDKGIIVISAHGVKPAIIEKAENKGLTIVDATCKYVAYAQKSVQKYLEEGYEIVYIGEKDHPEAQAITGMSPDRIRLITTADQLATLGAFGDKLLVTTQTTMNHQTITGLFRDIKAKYPQAVILDEICSATRKRQQALSDLSEVLDLLLVVGDPSSNNANKLLEIGRSKDIFRVELITSVTDLKDIDLKETKKIGVTSAASTPTYLTDQVIRYLQEYPKGQIPPLNLRDIL